MNKLDAALVASALEAAGFSLIDSANDADVVLINTCSVRDHAEQRVLSHLGHLKHIKKSRPGMMVGVIGCMAQRLGEQLLEHDTVDLVCGPAQIPQIPQLLARALQEKNVGCAPHTKKWWAQPTLQTVAITERIRHRQAEKQVQALEEFESAYGIEDKQLPGQAFVRAMRGCNNFCSYCVVPFVRGPEVCRPPAAIMEQIKKLADAGVRQVTLLGQTVNSYKYTAGEKTYCLADLLAMASDVGGIEWVKFVTSYPSEEFFGEILQVMADSPKVCRYLHMPAQSGSDRILRAMNRHYTAGRYLELLDKARAIVPDIAIAGDFIVGFPDETEEDFQATVSLVRRARYKNCFIFKYSPRPGTGADKKLQDSVPIELKKRRNMELLVVQEKISDQLSRDFLGQEVRVLVEGPSKKPHLNSADSPDKPQLVARTAGDWIVVFNGPPSLAGQFAKVTITKTRPLTLFGQLT
jgi:tRNA-2-methylthio-N6-dimethylallyladenosine synthase